MKYWKSTVRFCRIVLIVRFWIDFFICPLVEFMCFYTNNNNNNNRLLYSAFPNYDQSASQYIITPVIGFRHNSALKVHFLHSLGSIPASRRFIGAHVPTQPQFRSHPTGSPFNTWVESSNVDKVSCWRTKVPCESGNRTRTLSVRVERSLHYTTAPPQSTFADHCAALCAHYGMNIITIRNWPTCTLCILEIQTFYTSALL